MYLFVEFKPDTTITTIEDLKRSVSSQKIDRSTGTVVRNKSTGDMRQHTSTEDHIKGVETNTIRPVYIYISVRF